MVCGGCTSERLSLTINVRSENIPFGDRHAVELLAPLLVGQRKKAEPFGGKVESAAQPPQAIVLFRGSARFWDRRAIDKADAPAMRRRLAAKQLANQVLEPSLAIAQAFQQRHIRKVRKLDGRRPGARRSKPHPAQAISQDKPKQIAGGFHRPRTKEGARLAGASLDRGRPAKPGQCPQPKFIEKRFRSHATLGI